MILASITTDTLVSTSIIILFRSSATTSTTLAIRALSTPVNPLVVKVVLMMRTVITTTMGTRKISTTMAETQARAITVTTTSFSFRWMKKAILFRHTVAAGPILMRGTTIDSPVSRCAVMSIAVTVAAVSWAVETAMIVALALVLRAVVMVMGMRVMMEIAVKLWLIYKPHNIF